LRSNKYDVCRGTIKSNMVLDNAQGTFEIFK